MRAFTARGGDHARDRHGAPYDSPFRGLQTHLYSNPRAHKVAVPAGQCRSGNSGRSFGFLGNHEITSGSSRSAFFPPLFCGVTLIQLYLHAIIKSSARYINFKLRPHLQPLIPSNPAHRSATSDVWSWEDYYVGSHRLARFLIRLLGSFIILLSWLLALASLIVYRLILIASNVTAAPTEGWFIADSVLVALTLLLFIYIHYINERWWKAEEQSLSRPDGRIARKRRPQGR